MASTDGTHTLPWRIRNEPDPVEHVAAAAAPCGALTPENTNKILDGARCFRGYRVTTQEEEFWDGGITSGSQCDDHVL